MPTSRPTLLGDLQPPAPRAAMLARGHQPPDPHGRPTLLGDLQPPAPRATMPARGHQPPDPHGRPTLLGDLRPLPDPAAVRLCLIPDPAPPYDADASGDARPGTAPARDGAAGAGGRSWPAGDRAGEHPSAVAAVPPSWPSRFAQVLAETLAGSRPPVQMVPWTTEMARGHIRRLGPQLASGQRPRVRRVVTFQPASDVLEMTVVVGFGSRVRALAVRLERAGPPADADARRPGTSRWLCTAVEAA